MGGDDLVVAAHLALHPGLAVDEGDDGADAHQLAHDRGGGRDAAALLHLLEAVGSEDDLHLVHLGLKLADDVAELRAVLQLAGHLAQIPAEHHRVGVGVEQMDVQVVFRALLPQHPLGHDGVVVGGRAGAVDGDMDDIGVALVHILAVFLTELDGGDGSRGGDALGGAHLVVELLGGVLFTLHDVFVVQQDVEAHNVDAVFSASSCGMSQEERSNRDLLIVFLISIRSLAGGRGPAAPGSPTGAVPRIRPRRRCWTGSGCGRCPAWASGCSAPDRLPAAPPADRHLPARTRGKPHPGRRRRCSAGALWS